MSWTTLEFSAVLKPTEPVYPNLAKHAALAEQSGFTNIGVEDYPLLPNQRPRELYITLSTIAVNTKRAKIGPWVTNPYSCHPTSTAHRISTLDELSGGRAILGFAIGGPSAKALAPNKRHYANSEEAIRMIRAMFSGEAVEVNGWKYRLNVPTAHIPIYWAAQAEGSLRFGGRLADGIILSNWVDEVSIRNALKDIEKGAADSGRTLDDLPVFFMIATSISPDGQKALNDVTPYVSMVLNTTAADRLPEWGKDEEVVREFTRKFSWQKMHIEQEADKMVPKEMIAKKALAGTPEECIKVLKSLEKMGIKRVAMLLECSDVDETLQQFKKNVLPQFNDS